MRATRLAAGLALLVLATSTFDYAVDRLFRCQSVGEHVVSYLLMPWTMSNVCDRLRYDGEVVSFVFRAVAFLVFGYVTWAP